MIKTNKIIVRYQRKLYSLVITELADKITEFTIYKDQNPDLLVTIYPMESNCDVMRVKISELEYVKSDNPNSIGWAK